MNVMMVIHRMTNAMIHVIATQQCKTSMTVTFLLKAISSDFTRKKFLLTAKSMITITALHNPTIFHYFACSALFFMCSLNLSLCSSDNQHY